MTTACPHLSNVGRFPKANYSQAEGQRRYCNLRAQFVTLLFFSQISSAKSLVQRGVRGFAAKRKEKNRIFFYAVNESF